MNRRSLITIVLLIGVVAASIVYQRMHSSSLKGQFVGYWHDMCNEDKDCVSIHGEGYHCLATVCGIISTCGDGICAPQWTDYYGNILAQGEGDSCPQDCGNPCDNDPYAEGCPLHESTSSSSCGYYKNTETQGPGAQNDVPVYVPCEKPAVCGDGIQNGDENLCTCEKDFGAVGSGGNRTYSDAQKAECSCPNATGDALACKTIGAEQCDSAFETCCNASCKVTECSNGKGPQPDDEVFADGKKGDRDFYVAIGQQNSPGVDAGDLGCQTDDGKGALVYDPRKDSETDAYNLGELPPLNVTDWGAKSPDVATTGNWFSRFVASFVSVPKPDNKTINDLRREECTNGVVVVLNKAENKITDNAGTVLKNFSTQTMLACALKRPEGSINGSSGNPPPAENYNAIAINCSNSCTKDAKAKMIAEGIDPNGEGQTQEILKEWCVSECFCGGQLAAVEADIEKLNKWLTARSAEVMNSKSTDQQKADRIKALQDRYNAEREKTDPIYRKIKGLPAVSFDTNTSPNRSWMASLLATVTPSQNDPPPSNPADEHPSTIDGVPTSPTYTPKVIVNIPVPVLKPLPGDPPPPPVDLSNPANTLDPVDPVADAAAVAAALRGQGGTPASFFLQCMHDKRPDGTPLNGCNFNADCCRGYAIQQQCPYTRLTSPSTPYLSICDFLSQVGLPCVMGGGGGGGGGGGNNQAATNSAAPGFTTQSGTSTAGTNGGGNGGGGGSAARSFPNSVVSSRISSTSSSSSRSSSAISTSSVSVRSSVGSLSSSAICPPNACSLNNNTGNLYCQSAGLLCEQIATLPCMQCVRAQTSSSEYSFSSSSFSSSSYTYYSYSSYSTPVFSNSSTISRSSDSFTRGSLPWSNVSSSTGPFVLEETNSIPYQRVSSAPLQLALVPSICGNGQTETGEECDDENKRDFDGCSSDCLLERGYCGDGIVEKLLGEKCEPSLMNGDLPYACDGRCQFFSQTCGDGTVDLGEECDNGTQNSNAPNSECRLNCSHARCGDGIVDAPTEACDDNNRLNGDGCSSSCQIEKPATTNPLIGQIFDLGMTPQAPQQPYQLLPVTAPTHSPVGQTGPASAAIMAAGAAAGMGWVRRKKKH